MVDHTWGVDASHYDPTAGRAATLVDEGFGFFTHKAGGDANDAQLAAWWNDAKQHRPDLLLGAYWVLYPGHGAGAADTFLARLDSQCPGWRDGPFILQLDCEIWGGDTSTQPGLGDIRACANRLRVLAPKLVPIVYAPHWAYGNSLNGLGFPLWSSSYTTATGPASVIYPGDSYSGWDAYSGIVPSIAQFSSTCTVGSDNTTDVNVFKGTPDQLQALLAPGWSTVATLDTDDKNWFLNTFLPALFAYQLEDPYDTTVPPRKVTFGGWTRYMPSRNLVDTRLSSAAGLAQAFQIFAATPPVPATVDVAALTASLTAALTPLLTGNEGMTEAEMQALIEASIRDLINGSTPAGNQLPAFDHKLGADSWDPVAADDRPSSAEPHNLVADHVSHDGDDVPSGASTRSDTPIHDEAADAVTRTLRQERQPDIEG